MEEEEEGGTCARSVTYSVGREVQRMKGASSLPSSLASTCRLGLTRLFGANFPPPKCQSVSDLEYLAALAVDILQDDHRGPPALQASRPRHPARRTVFLSLVSSARCAGVQKQTPKVQAGPPPGDVVLALLHRRLVAPEHGDGVGGDLLGASVEQGACSYTIRAC